MGLVTLKEILTDARKRKYGVAMFNTLNLEMLRGVLRAAEEEHAPVIVALAEVHFPYSPLEQVGPVVVQAAREAKVPVAVHMDHGMTLERIVMAMRLGFTSVMYDGSTLSYEDNIARTREVVELARMFGASVEAELGHVGGGEGGEDDGHEEIYTRVEDAADFVERTAIDALAVAIGTVHGVYKNAPKLDINRLSAINARAGIPLVLHGGSGLTNENFGECIREGISKVNFCTDLLLAATAQLKEDLQIGNLPFPDLMKSMEHAFCMEAKRKIVLIGATGKA